VGCRGFIGADAGARAALETIERVLAGAVVVPDDLAAQAAHDPSALRKALGGITSRQLEVARLAADGRTNSEISAILGISVGTVKVHLSAMFKTSGARNRADAARMLLERQHPVSLPQDPSAVE
jgi:DNA-binding NarL/FixJ family response regulator